MLIIIDNKIPFQAKENLSKIGKLCCLKSTNIVYDAISGHPDIFLFQTNDKIIIAPQSPTNLKQELDNYNILYEIGNSDLGSKYPFTASYNVAFGDDIFIGNSKYSDSKILELSKDKKWIESPQAYSRCNTIILNQEFILTSEPTVAKSLPNALLIDSKSILLEGFSHGFFGGCCGIFENKMFILGKLKYHNQSEEILKYVEKAGFNIVELYDGPLIDFGGIFFIT